MTGLEMSVQPPIKLVIVLQDLEFGGTQRYAINLMNHLDRSRFSPELWVLRGGRQMLPLLETSVPPPRFFSEAGWVTPLALLRFYLALIKTKPHILYPLTVVPNIWGRFLGWLAGIPTIVSSYRNLIAKQHDRLLLPLSTHVICNASTLKKRLIDTYNLQSERISVIPNGTNTDLFTPKPVTETPPTILFAGRLVPQKDPVTLLNSFIKIRQHLPTTRLIILGNGPLLGKLQDFIARHQLQQVVEFFPGNLEVRSFMQRAHLFVLPSRYEGSPNVLIEAMACGLPVIATRTSGSEEIVEHGHNGYLINQGDSDAITRYSLRLLRNDGMRQELGKHARQRITAEYSLAQQIQATEELFLRLVNCQT